jgi:hypothetical protein
MRRLDVSCGARAHRSRQRGESNRIDLSRPSTRRNVLVSGKADIESGDSTDSLQARGREFDSAHEGSCLNRFYFRIHANTHGANDQKPTLPQGIKPNRCYMRSFKSSLSSALTSLIHTEQPVTPGVRQKQRSFSEVRYFRTR